MKTSIKTILFALAAIISLAACSSDDDYTTPTEKDLFGAWELTYADKRIQVDGATNYYLDPYGKFTIESINYLDPEYQTHVEYGNWTLINSGNKNILTISYRYEDPMTGEEITQTSSLTVTKFSGNQFHAFNEGSTTELIFTRITQNYLF